MITRMSLLAVACCLGAYFLSTSFYFSTDKPSDRKPVIGLETQNLAVESETDRKSLKPTFNRTVYNSDLEVRQAVASKHVLYTELEMDESLARLHLKEFTEYLRGERASEHTTLAFYTDSRWYEFYERIGYPAEDIHQLIAFRSQFLADISQSGKKYYYHRWSDAPHRSVAETLAYQIVPYLGNGENWELALSNSISDVASEYGITTQIVERVAKEYLLNAIGTIEASALFSSPTDPKVDVIKFDSDFVEYLKEQAGYTKNTIVIDENLLDVYSSNAN
ncbi:hypothetical protein L1D14_07245 [Vibrio tubiashii]|uniref:hypothetical protein n=1 Tax=Vibrio tubiashii TaxID=29498 RepID=UPI001EFDD429|nr:hypothetical protein [Vibrio tubiashii]MCG9576032.1 hypothetical protein [Vibrio tubiashii]